MRLTCICAALCAVAWSLGCERPSAPPASDTTASAARPKVVMPSTTSAALPGLVPVTSGPALVGALEENQHASTTAPSDYCVDGTLYRGAPYRLARVNVFGVDSQLAAAHAGKAQAVIVYGQKRPSLWSALTQAGPCPDEEELMAQMRSDWVAPEGGYFATSRARLEEQPYLLGTSARAVTLYELLDADETQVRVRVFNPFDAPYAEMTFVAHYEGGPGKPMPVYDEQILALAPGASVELTVPRSADPEGKEPPTKMGYGLHSLGLVGLAGQARIDADLFIRHF